MLMLSLFMLGYSTRLTRGIVCGGSTTKHNLLVCGFLHTPLWSRAGSKPQDFFKVVVCKVALNGEISDIQPTPSRLTSLTVCQPFHDDVQLKEVLAKAKSTAERIWNEFFSLAECQDRIKIMEKKRSNETVGQEGIKYNIYIVIIVLLVQLFKKNIHM
jgi:hypothetical protein